VNIMEAFLITSNLLVYIYIYIYVCVCVCVCMCVCVCVCWCVQPTFVSWQECSVHGTSAARVSFVFTCVAAEFPPSHVFSV
jgi:hypothetical protein